MKQFSENAKRRRLSSSVSNETAPKICQTSTSKPKKLTNVDVSKFLVSNNIRDQTKLMAIANDRHSAGEKDLYRFIISRSSKSLSELIDMTWKINNASSELEREQQKDFYSQEASGAGMYSWMR